MLLIVRKEEVAFWLLDVIVGNLLPGIVINSILLQLIILLLKNANQMLPSISAMFFQNNIESEQCQLFSFEKY